MYLLPFIGYLSGSLTFAIWITRWVTGRDVRAGGSGHATTTNTIRQAGWPAGVAVFVLDVSKGFLPTWLAVRWGAPGWLIAATAAAAVVGHCWPWLADFRGGMGLATAFGTLLATRWLGALVALAVLLVLVLALHHAARGAALAGLLAPLVLRLFGLHGLLDWVAPAVGLVIFIRFLDDWQRQYRELWLDRERP